MIYKKGSIQFSLCVCAIKFSLCVCGKLSASRGKAPLTPIHWTSVWEPAHAKLVIITRKMGSSRDFKSRKFQVKSSFENKKSWLSSHKSSKSSHESVSKWLVIIRCYPLYTLIDMIFLIHFRLLTAIFNLRRETVLALAHSRSSNPKHGVYNCI